MKKCRTEKLRQLRHTWKNVALIWNETAKLNFLFSRDSLFPFLHPEIIHVSRNENGRRAYECIKFLTNATNQLGGFKEYLSQGAKEKEQLEWAVKWLEKKVAAAAYIVLCRFHKVNNETRIIQPTFSRNIIEYLFR